MINEELISIVRLLEDPDETVRSAVNARLLEMNPSVIDDLRELRSGHGELLSSEEKHQVAVQIGRLDRELALKRISNLVSSDEISLPYFYSQISTLVMPELDRDLFISQINCMVSEFLKEINERQTAVEQMEIFNHIFFHRHHFTVGPYSPDKADTAFLPSVIDSGNGNPVAILLLYFMMAREVGLDVRPVCVRHGMVPIVMENDIPLFFIDLNQNGSLVSDSIFLHSLFRGREVDDCSIELPGVNILPLIYAKSLLIPYSTGISAEYLERVIRILSET